MTTIFDNEKPFGLMSKDPVRLAEMQAEMRDWPHGWECYGLDGWTISTKPFWFDHILYRAIPAPVTLDSIDWSHVHPDIVAIARDDDGRPFGYECRPTLKEYCWRDDGPERCIAGVFASYKMGTCDWRESLLIRPEAGK
jgi:hypothetical protein